MSTAIVVPLSVVVVLLTPMALARVHEPTDRVIARLSVGLFGAYVDEFSGQHPDRRAALRAAHVPATYREYGSRTYLYATAFTLVGSVLGLYAVWGVLRLLAIDPETLETALPSTLSFLANLGGVPELTIAELFALLLASSVTFGIATGLAGYWLRWWYPSYVADTRARQIEATLPATVAFCYALSRSGMEFPDVVRTVADSEDTYGRAAEEFDVAVRNMDTFGMDVVSALETMGRRTASDGFREFTENLVSVLKSGQGISAFLEQQYRDYQEEAESHQESMLGMLATLAEAYVTVLVAGPLFLITILVVIGFSVSDTIEPLQALIYFVLPVGNLAFVVYLSTVTESIASGRQDRPASTHRSLPQFPDGVDVQPDGGVDAGVASVDRPDTETLHRLRIYRRLRSVRRWLGRPTEAILERPARLFVVTGPIALAAIAWLGPQARDQGIGAVDDAMVIVGLFLLGTFAVAYELHRLRIAEIEAAVPDLLDRLASVNDAGMPVVASIDHVRGSDLGPLGEELNRVWADVQWGADLETALWRFESRVNTRGISRVVTLVTRSMAASGELATVLRIAARQATADRRLARERKRAMLEYTVVVYVSFLVFLFIIVVLSSYLLPNLPTEAADVEAVGSVGGGLGDVGDVDTEAYTTLFYHATIIQGALSGLIAGQLSSGDVRAGAKHATFMMVVGLLLFAIII